MTLKKQKNSAVKFPADDEIIFLPLGGAEEIGMNLNAYGHDDAWIIVDFGIGFANDYLMGVDIIMSSPEYLASQKEKILGIVLTHAHEDHLGAIGYLWRELQCPIYATGFTASLLRNKLLEAGLLDIVAINIIAPTEDFQLGPFSLKLINITHSIPEPNALLISTKAGKVMHTGDWKLDPEPLIGEITDIESLKAFGDEGVLAMVCDSTNVFVEGTALSEGVVAQNLVKKMSGIQGRILITCFASNVARVHAIGLAAKKLKRQICTTGRSFSRIIEAAKENGYLLDFPPIISEQQAMDLPKNRVLFLATGSQGEPRAAMAKIAKEEHPKIGLDAGDTAIFSARIIPGNEQSVAYLQNLLAKQGINIINDEDDIHASGHPCRDDLAQLYQWIRPQVAIPVHGEQRHLQEHVKLIKNLQIPHALMPYNGALIRLANRQTPKIIGSVPAPVLAMDGGQLINIDDDSLKQRRKISNEGIIFISVFVAKKPNHKIQASVDMDIIGLAIDEATKNLVMDKILDLTQEYLGDYDGLGEQVRLLARRFVRQKYDKNPPVIVHISFG